MAISFRHYLFLGDGSICRIPKRIANSLPTGDDAVPEFAGTRQRVATVVVENWDGRPVRIFDVKGRFWTFDAEGRVDEDLQRQAWEHIEAHTRAARARRADLVPEIKRRELIDRDSWTPSAEELDRTAADLWPGVHGPAPRSGGSRAPSPRRRG